MTAMTIPARPEQDDAGLRPIPWRRMASPPNTAPSAAATTIPARIAVAGPKACAVMSQELTYAAKPKNAAWPKDSIPP